MRLRGCTKTGLPSVARPALLRHIGPQASSGKWPGLPKAPPLGELSPKVTERARKLTKNRRRSDSIALPKRQLIAAWQLPGDGLALSVTADAVPPLPEGEALASRATSYWTPEVRYGAKGRALLQRAAASGQRTLSSCRCPGQRSTPVPETSCFASFSGNLTDMPKPPLDRGGGCAKGADGEVQSTAASKPDRKIANTKNYQMTSRNIF